MAKWTVALSAAGVGLLGNKFLPDEVSKDEEHPQGMSRYDEKVELIFLSPMPHASIRVGGLVYNYGVFQVNRYRLEEFFNQAGFGDSVSGNYTRIELKLTPEERSKLRDLLEEDVGKIYPLVFPYNDCVAETNKKVKFATGIDVPVIMDRSQVGTIAYYKLQKLLHPDRVGEIYFVNKKGSRPVVEKTKDAVVNVIDSVYFIRKAKNMFFVTPFLDRRNTTFEPPSPDKKPEEEGEEE